MLPCSCKTTLELKVRVDFSLRNLGDLQSLSGRTERAMLERSLVALSVVEWPLLIAQINVAAPVELNRSAPSSS